MVTIRLSSYYKCNNRGAYLIEAFAPKKRGETWQQPEAKRK